MSEIGHNGIGPFGLDTRWWKCEKCGASMPQTAIAAHADWHDKQADLANAGLRADGVGPTIDDGFPNNTCPKCGASKGNGHADDCVTRGESS